MLQLTRHGLAAPLPDSERRALSAHFAEHRYVHIRQLLTEDLLAFALRHVTASAFFEEKHHEIAADHAMMPNPALSLLHFAFNDPALLRLVEELTGCEPIAGFRGRVFRFVPGAGHFDSWHSDNVQGRRIGVSLNLSVDVYEGGHFQLLDDPRQRLLCDIANTGLGDAVLFRIASGLEHRATEVTGTVPRTTFAGWFVSDLSLVSLLEEFGSEEVGLARARAEV